MFLKIKELRNNLQDRIRSKPIVLRFFNYFALFLFFLTTYFALSLESIRPFNYILIAIWVFYSLYIVFYIFLFGNFRINNYVVLSLIFVVLQLLSWGLSGFQRFNQTSLLLGAMSIVLSLLFENNKDNIKKYAFCLLAATWFLLITFLLLHFDGVVHPNISNRIGTRMGNANDVARHLAFSVLINTSSIFYFKNKIIKVFSALGLVVGLYFLILTGSVSNFIVTAFVIFLLPLIIFRKKKLIIVIIVYFCIFALLIILMNLPFMSYFKDRIISMFSSIAGGANGDDSFEARFMAACYGVRLFFYRPFFGNGFDSVYSSYNIMAHNNIVEILADFGFFAFLVEEMIIILPIYKIIKKPFLVTFKKQAIFVASLMFYIIFLQFFLVNYNSKVESIIIPLCYAICGLNDEPIIRYNSLHFVVDNYLEVNI